MGPRTRRFLAMIGVLAFFVFWVWAVLEVRRFMPPGPLIDLLFYAIAGIGWGVPLYPLFKWAEGRKPR